MYLTDFLHITCNSQIPVYYLYLLLHSVSIQNVQDIISTFVFVIMYWVPSIPHYHYNLSILLNIPTVKLSFPICSCLYISIHSSIHTPSLVFVNHFKDALVNSNHFWMPGGINIFSCPLRYGQSLRKKAQCQIRFISKFTCQRINDCLCMLDLPQRKEMNKEIRRGKRRFFVACAMLGCTPPKPSPQWAVPTALISVGFISFLPLLSAW